MSAYLTRDQIIKALNISPGSFQYYTLKAGIKPVKDAVIFEREIWGRMRKFFADGYPLDSLERIKAEMPEGK